jgi:hypothetical protein
MGKKRDKKRRTSTDPRTLTGGFVGPGGPHDEGGIIIDASHAVLLADASFARIDDTDQPTVAMLLSGPIARTPDRAHVLFVLDINGVATLLTEIYALIGRMGSDAQALKADVEERMARMQREGLLDRHHHHHHEHPDG